MAAGALLANGELPGLWAILTGFDPELVPADPLDANAPAPVTECLAVALALMPPAPGQSGICLTVGAAGTDELDGAEWPEFSLENLAYALAGGETVMQWGLRCGGWAVWEHAEADAEMCLSSASCPILITGVGAATPLGHSYRTIADGLLAGRSGVQAVTGFDVSEHPSRIAGQVEKVPCPPGWDENKFNKLSRLEQLCLWCCSAALRDSGWWERRGDIRLGVVLGIGAECLVQWEADALVGGKGIFHPDHDNESVVRKTCRALQLSGPAHERLRCVCQRQLRPCPGAALAAAWLGRRLPRRRLRHGGDAHVPGRVRQPPCSLARNDQPELASRPFDKERDGFVMGEGGAVFILERADSARKRTANVYAEVAGCAHSSDAHNMVIPSPNPEPATAAVRQALADARVNPGEVDYLNAHATSTPVGDVAESRVLETVFGPALPRVPVSSTKSMTGHLLTAAAAVEALACLVAMQRRACHRLSICTNPIPIVICAMSPTRRKPTRCGWQFPTRSGSAAAIRAWYCERRNTSATPNQHASLGSGCGSRRRLRLR